MKLEEYNLTKGELYAIIDALDETVNNEIIIDNVKFRNYLQKNGIIEIVEKKFCYKTNKFNEWRDEIVKSINNC